MTSDTTSPESNETDGGSPLGETPLDAEVGTLDVADSLFHNAPIQPPAKDRSGGATVPESNG
jgi:hypothetical protein